MHTVRIVIRKVAKSIVFMSLLATLVACINTTPTRMAVPALVESQRAETVLIMLPQREIQVDKPDVNAGGGLLGAIVEGIAESTMDKNRQKALAPIRDLVVAYDFEKRYIDTLKTNLPSSMVSPNAEYVVVRDAKEYEDRLVQINGKNAVAVVTRYAFDQNFNMLYVDSGVRFGDIGWVRDSKGRATPKYKNDKALAGKVTYAGYDSHFPLEKYQGYDESVVVWGANNGALLIEKLDIALVELADLLKRDFATPIAASASAPTANIKYPSGAKLKGYQVETRGARTLYAVSASRIWRPSVAKK
jgi:hypothetical protein